MVVESDWFVLFAFRYGGFSGYPPEYNLSYHSRGGIKNQPKRDLFLSIEHGRNTLLLSIMLFVTTDIESIPKKPPLSDLFTKLSEKTKGYFCLKTE